MLCVTTSITLLDSILNRAGSLTQSQYREKYRVTNNFIIDGGATSAKKILCVAWKLEVQKSDVFKAQQVYRRIFF